MKSKPPRPLPPSSAEPSSRAHLKALQDLMATALFRPLTKDDRMQKRWVDGTAMAKQAETFIKPNDRLTSFERLEIYNRCYWFRLLDCLYDDYPGLLAVLGERKFMALITAYLTKYQSTSFTLRNLGEKLEQFVREEPKWIEPRVELGLDMVRFEWAQVLAFDEGSRKAITPDDILDIQPGELKLALQPYVSLLELNFAVDDFLLAVKKLDTDVLRSEASNVVDGMPGKGPRRKRPRLPKKERIHLAVHRHDNMLYYKRLEPEAFGILTALHCGLPVEAACMEALSATARTDVDWAVQIKDWFTNWTSLGWFCRPA